MGYGGFEKNFTIYIISFNIQVCFRYLMI